MNVFFSLYLSVLLCKQIMLLSNKIVTKSVTPEGRRRTNWSFSVKLFSLCLQTGQTYETCLKWQKRTHTAWRWCPPPIPQLGKDMRRMWIHLLVSSKSSSYMRRQVTAFVMLLSSASGIEGGASPAFHSRADVGLLWCVTEVLMPFSSRLHSRQIFFLETAVLREMGN